MKLASCISWDEAKFDAVPFRGMVAYHVVLSAKIGFSGIELAIRDPLAIDVSEIPSMLELHKLELCAIGTGQAWGEDGLSFTHPNREVRETAVERVISHFPLAKQTGAIVIIGLLRGVLLSENDIDSSIAQEWMYECFSKCCEIASKEGVRIAFEPINRYETSFINNIEEGLEFIHKVGTDNLGLLIDTFHMNIEEPSIEDSIKMAGDKIFHVHYADSNRMYPGAGHIDFPSIVATLRDIGYSAYLSGEHRWIPDPEMTVRKGYEHMASLL